MNKDIRYKILGEAKKSARLQFHPSYSRDAYIACTTCYQQGAEMILSNPGLLREQMEEFVIWFTDNISIFNGFFFDKNQCLKSPRQLFDLYIEHLKQKASEL